MCSRQVDAWPNNEFASVEDAFFMRQDGDYSFEGSFLDTKIAYDNASEILDDILSSADKQVEDLLTEGERYLYREEKPIGLNLTLERHFLMILRMKELKEA